jgi:very-short-patch-repair endonuclease/predicted transcriptional regulator of viral defense system
VDRPTQLVPDIAAKTALVDRVLARLAGRQHGVVARRQLLALGLTRHAIQDRITSGHLHRLHRGVYAVGHRLLTAKGRWMAAVLAAGPDALLSHRQALSLWDLLRIPSGAIDVTVPGRTGRRGPKGIRMHHSEHLTATDRTQIDNIPVTSLAWTLVDHAATAHPQRVRSVLEQVQRRELHVDLDELLERFPNRKGSKAIRVALAQMRGPAPWTQSELEDRFLALIREAGLPEPETNVLVEGELVDALWRDQRLIVEVDGYEFHKSRAQFESDRRRDAKLQVAGYRVLRVTQRRLQDDAGAVLAEILALLSEPRAA